MVALLLADRPQVIMYFLATTYSLVSKKRPTNAFLQSSVEVEYRGFANFQHQRTKHREIDIHFVRDLVVAGEVYILHVASRYQYADIFTKRLPSALFEKIRTSLSVRYPPTPTVGEC
ncbi:ribonuclease H-like domain-containing protein [Tanacetum coccineum]